MYEALRNWTSLVFPIVSPQMEVGWRVVFVLALWASMSSYRLSFSSFGKVAGLRSRASRRVGGHRAFFGILLQDSLFFFSGLGVGKGGWGVDSYFCTLLVFRTFVLFSVSGELVELGGFRIHELVRVFGVLGDEVGLGGMEGVGSVWVLYIYGLERCLMGCC